MNSALWEGAVLLLSMAWARNDFCHFLFCLTKLFSFSVWKVVVLAEERRNDGKVGEVPRHSAE